MTDGGVDADGGTVLPFDLAPPDIPWLDDGEPSLPPPTLGDCPDGWTATDVAGVQVCEPWPRASGLDCPPGESQLGGATCAPVGTTCPSGDYADDLPAGSSVVYVREGATGMSDGSMGAPYGSLRNAIRDGLASGTVVALSRGTHLVEDPIPSGVHLVGACAAETVLVRGTRRDEAVVEVTTSDVTLENLSVDAAGGTGIEARGGSLTVQGVEVVGGSCVGVGIYDGSSLSATRLTVRDTSPCDPSSTATPGGLVVEDGGVADVQQSTFVGNDTFSIRVHGGLPTAETRLSIEDSVVRNTASDPGEALAARQAGQILGVGLFANEETGEPTASTTVDVARTLFERHPGGNIVLRGAGTTGDFDQLALREAGSLEATLVYSHIASVNALDGATVTIQRSYVTGTLIEATAGAITIRDGATAMLSDLVIAENKCSAMYAEGPGATIDAERVVMDGNRSGGVGAAFGAIVRMRHVRISDPASEGLLDLEVPAVSGTAVITLLSEIELRESIISGHIEAVTALFDSRVTVEDVLVRDLGRLGGGALIADDGTEITARRFVAERAGSRAISIFRSSSLVLEDAIVRDTRPDFDSSLGRALDVELDSRAELHRVELVASRDVAVFTFGDSEVLLEDSRIVDTSLQECVDTIGCVGHGHALGAYDFARVTATRFVIESAATCGVHLALDAEVDLSDGLVTEAEIGACVQVDDYDVDRLSMDVAYRDNQTNLDSTSLPVPEPAAGF
jgi:hypothetical protein